MKRLPFILSITFFYVTYSQDNSNVLFLDNWQDTTINTGPEGSRFNTLISFKYLGGDYAAVGSNNGVHIIKIENNQLQFIDFIAGKHQSILAENRDYAVYQNYIYAVCDEGPSSLQIIDFSFLPDSVSLVYDSNINFINAHTVFTDTLHAKLYVCGANNAAMKIFDISNPVNPVLIEDFNDVAYVHDGYVNNDTAYLNCGFDGLYIYDFSLPGGMLLGKLDFYANQGYNHSGWLSPDGKKYAFTDETEGSKIKLCLINNLADIKVDEEFGTKNYQDFIAHEMILLNNLLFCAYYNEGLRIYNVSNFPAKEIGSYDTYLNNSNFKMNGAWGVAVIEQKNYVLVSDRQNGLYLFYFPIQELNQTNFTSNVIYANPIIHQNRLIIPVDLLLENDIYFTITTMAGQKIIEQQNDINWIQVPDNLTAGVYLYNIYNAQKEHLISGKFIVVE